LIGLNLANAFFQCGTHSFVVIPIGHLAIHFAKQASGAVEGVDVVRAQTDELGGIARINDSGVRILHSARALRKAAVGK